MRSFDRYQDLLQHIEKSGHKPTVLGKAPDGAPIVSVKTGGDRDPAIFISAGSRSTEQAGVSAAVALIDELNSDHKTYVIPSRDPMGMNGFAYALSLSLGEVPTLGGLDDAEALLRERGEVVYEEGETLLVIIGEYGYSTHGLLGKFDDRRGLMEPLIGRRIFFPSRSNDIEGTAPLQRAYTLIVAPDGEVLHINRFHDTSWAPAEPRCTRDLMAEINPGLTLDLHEFGGSAFWFSARHQRNDDDEQWEQRMADAMIAAADEARVERMPENYLPGSFFTRQEPSVYWLNAQERGEGLNLADFAANRYGPAFTIETGMKGTFQHRVETSMLAATTAVRVFEERHR